MLFLLLGKIQRQMYSAGRVSAKAVVTTLIRAIDTSYTSDHDLGLVIAFISCLAFCTCQKNP